MYPHILKHVVLVLVLVMVDASSGAAVQLCS